VPVEHYANGSAIFLPGVHNSTPVEQFANESAIFPSEGDSNRPYFWLSLRELKDQSDYRLVCAPRHKYLSDALFLTILVFLWIAVRDDSRQFGYTLTRVKLFIAMVLLCILADICGL
jgi:hypothetical protein